MTKAVKSTRQWLYITLALFVLFIIVLFIVISYQQRIRLSMPVYFFLLTIAALAATAFLTGALKSSAEYSGTLAKGNLRITGSIVVFLLIIFTGYRFRPLPEAAAFDLTMLLRNPISRPDRPLNGTVQIILDNDIRSEAIDARGKAVFANLNPGYAGKLVPVSADIEGFRISNAKDTMVTIPEGPLPVIRLTLFEVADSALFSGYLLRTNPGKPSGIIAGARLLFNDFDKIAETDSAGRFRIYLNAKTGEPTHVDAFLGNRMIFSGKASLSRTMQIIAHE